MNILYVQRFSMYPPRSGGELRRFHIMDQLSRFHHVDVLSWQTERDYRDHDRTGRSISFFAPSASDQCEGDSSRLLTRIRQATRFRWLRRSLSGPANTIVPAFASELEHLLQQKIYAAVIFTDLTTAMLGRVTKRWQRDALTIYDAHNIDHTLIEEPAHRRMVHGIEQRLYNEIDHFWACSQQDVDSIALLNNGRITGTLIPNGVDTCLATLDPDKRGKESRLLFCGTLSWPPNIEGLTWFLEKVWPLLVNTNPGMTLTIIGRDSDRAVEWLPMQRGVELVGEVEDVRSAYRGSHIAIVPLLSGSGTRLKILEAMSFGNPVVSTTKGIEGIDAQHDRDALIADTPEDFVKSILRLTSDPATSDRLRLTARKNVEERYDWDLIGDRLQRELASLSHT